MALAIPLFITSCQKNTETKPDNQMQTMAATMHVSINNIPITIDDNTLYINSIAEYETMFENTTFDNLLSDVNNVKNLSNYTSYVEALESSNQNHVNDSAIATLEMIGNLTNDNGIVGIGDNVFLLNYTTQKVYVTNRDATAKNRLTAKNNGTPVSGVVTFEMESDVISIIDELGNGIYAPDFDEAQPMGGLFCKDRWADRNEISKYTTGIRYELFSIKEEVVAAVSKYGVYGVYFELLSKMYHHSGYPAPWDTKLTFKLDGQYYCKRRCGKSFSGSYSKGIKFAYTFQDFNDRAYYGPRALKEYTLKSKVTTYKMVLTTASTTTHAYYSETAWAEISDY